MGSILLKHFKLYYILFLFIIVSSISAKSPVRLKDLVTIDGVRENRLTGIGLVVGLQGKGDSKAFKMTAKMLASLTSNYGFDLSEEDLKSKNIAAVFVTAEIGGFVRNGDKVDVIVSSIGDSKSLDGGILLQTALQAANGTIYAAAQGRVIGGKAKTGTSSTAGIPAGAIVERSVVSDFITNGKLKLVLKNPDFTTSTLMREAIAAIDENISVTSVDPGLVEVTLSGDYLQNPVSFISQLELLTITPDNKAMIIIDKKSGMIISGGDVKIQDCVISTGDLKLKMSKSGGEKNLKISSNTIDELVDILNKAELESSQIIALLEAIHKSGALSAELIIL